MRPRYRDAAENGQQTMISRETLAQMRLQAVNTLIRVSERWYVLGNSREGDRVRAAALRSLQMILLLSKSSDLSPEFGNQVSVRCCELAKQLRGMGQK